MIEDDRAIRTSPRFALYNQGIYVKRTGQIASAEQLLLDLVVRLARQAPASTITLQTYLENLRWLAWRWSDHTALPFLEFIELLCVAFVPTSVAQDASGEAVDNFLAWEERLTEQIRDLGEHNDLPVLEVAKESHWFNFDPYTYLACAVAGAFGGSSFPADTLREVTWEEFADFLNAGQGNGPDVLLARSGDGLRGAEA